MAVIANNIAVIVVASNSSRDHIKAPYRHALIWIVLQSTVHNTSGPDEMKRKLTTAAQITSSLCCL